MKQLFSKSFKKTLPRIPIPHGPPPRFEEGEKGIYIILVSILLVALLTVLGLGIDSAKLYVDSLRLQRAADAAAVAAGSRIGDFNETTLVDLAQRVARDNLDRNRVSYDPSQISQHFPASMPTSNQIDVPAHTTSETFVIGRMVSGKGAWAIHGTASAQRRPVAIVLVADLSSSMNNNADPSCSGSCPDKVDALKAAAKAFMANFSPTEDAVSIVSFWGAVNCTNNSSLPFPINHELPMSKPWVPGNPSSTNPTEVNGVINNLYSRSGTNIQGGIWLARKEMERLGDVVNDPSAFLKVIVLITDGSPTRSHKNTTSYYPDSSYDPWPTSCSLQNDGTVDLEQKEEMLYTIVESDFARDQGYTLFTIGVGARDSENNIPWQTGNMSKLKTYLMRRLANDSLSAGVGSGNPDPEFPADCVPGYADLAGKPTGYFLDSPSGLDLTQMLQSVAFSIRLRLVQ